MKGKLIKTDIQYRLHNEEGIVIATSTDGKLSLKNCEEIANGYDLDELSENHAEEIYVRNENDYNELANFENRKRNFEEGFQKALEILGDKKFSVKDMEKLMFATIEFTEQKEGETYPFLKSFIQSLQQTEWDVEICCYLGNGDKESDSFKDTFVTNTGIPKLDSDGCLILRRI